MSSTITPMMQQYRDAKERHPGMLLLFRMGDFYELFDADAELAARLLGLTLTSRDKSMPMAGFPHHSLETYLRKLLQSGHRVAICDQVEDASQAKGLVRREVTRVVTPGTITEDNLLDPRRANHLVAIKSEKGDNVGLAWLDLSTGQFHAADIPWSRIMDEFSRLAPAELLCAEQDGDFIDARVQPALSGTTLTRRANFSFDGESARAVLHRHFNVSTLAGFGFEDKQICLKSAGALL